MLKLLMVVLMVLSFKRGKGDLYVREDGSANVSCGSLRLPCKYLHQAVNKSEKGGNVVVQGVQTVTSGIVITKDIAIVGFNAAAIRANTTDGFVFRITQRARFALKEIKFVGTAILSIESRAKVEITRCRIRHTSRPERLMNHRRSYSMIKLSNRAMGLSLSVFNSTFIGVQNVPVLFTSGYQAVLKLSIIFDKCGFTENSGILLNLTHYVNLRLKSCSFIGSNVVVRGDSGSLSVVKCLFRDIFGGALVVSTDQSSGISIYGTMFKNCRLGKLTTSCKSINGGAIAILGRKMSRETPTVDIIRCWFQENVNDINGGDIHVSKAGITRISSSTFFSSRIERTNCSVRGDEGGGSVKINQTNLIVTHSSFTYCNTTGNGGAISIYDSSSVNDMRTVKYALIGNCTFKGNKAEKEGGAIAIHTNKVIEIVSCYFDNNHADFGGGIMLKISGKNRPGTQTIIKNSILTQNTATYGGGVYIDRENLYTDTRRFMKQSPSGKSYFIVINHCNFTDNSAFLSGQSVHNNDHIQMIHTSVSSFERFIAPHLHLEKGNVGLVNITVDLFRNNELRLQGKSLGVMFKSKEIRVSKGFKLSCPINFRINEVKNSSEIVSKMEIKSNGRKLQVNLVYNFLMIGCTACHSPTTYSLKRGLYHVQKLPGTEKESKEFVPVINNPDCLPCPTGAICDVSIRAVDNYWGYLDASSQLSFHLCPGGFCCGSDTVLCDSYNTCATGRKGTLCGTCSEDYKQNFVGTDCILKGEPCDLMVFVAYFVLYTTLYTFIFVFITNINVIILKVRTLCSKRSSAIQTKENGAENKVRDNFSIAAFVQITVFFCQIAGLLQIKFHHALEQKKSTSNLGVRESITELFNFRFTIYQKVCPSDDLTLPQKEIILLAMKISTLIILMLLFFVHKVIKSLLRCCNSPKTDTQYEPSVELMCDRGDEIGVVEVSDLPEEDLVNLSFSNMLKFTLIKLLKIYYTPITKAALLMVHCIIIHNKSHLYVYGDLVYYSSWQVGIILIILPCLLLFPICFEVALRMLKNRQITSWQFVLATACPIYSIGLYAWIWIQERNEVNIRRKIRTGKEKIFRHTILEGEELLFKKVEGGSLGWQVIQLYRALAITILNTFVTNPLYRQIAYIVLLMGFVVHDGERKPYKDHYLNHLQSLSSRCLIIILVCNVIPAMSTLVNVQNIPYIVEIVEGLGVIELVALAVVPLSLPVWKLKDFIESKCEARHGTRNEE